MQRLVFKTTKMALAITCLLAIADQATLIAQQTDNGRPVQQMQQQQARQTFQTALQNVQPQMQVQLAEFDIALDAIAPEIVSIAAISPDEESAMRECLQKLLDGMDPATGDNLLAEAWDLEQGRIVRNKRGMNPAEVLTFDPEQGRLKDWFQQQLSRAVVESWVNGEITPTSVIDGDRYSVSLAFAGGTMNTVTFQKTEHGMKIVSIYFQSFYC